MPAETPRELYLNEVAREFGKPEPFPPKIVTSHIRPPIPTRSHDWCAHYDGEEERCEYGYGRTEQEAIADLTENYPR